MELFRDYKYRLAGEEVVLPRVFADFFGGRRAEHAVLAPYSAGRGLQGRHADSRGASTQTPNEDHIRAAMDQAGVRDATIQRVSDPSGHAANKVIICAAGVDGDGSGA